MIPLMKRVVLSLLLASNVAFADTVLPPGTGLGGQSPEQLSIRWWQWAMSVPGDSSPVNDPTGARCGAGQDGDVWFLAGGFRAEKIRRTCEVPAGKSLFFPIMQRGDRSRSCEQAKSAALLPSVATLELFAEIDGVPVTFPKRYRVTTRECFDVYAKVSPMLGQAQPHPSASDGFWLAVAPLSKGKHVIRFGGKYAGTSAELAKLAQDIEYELKVQ
jgi:hypothetical protein